MNFQQLQYVVELFKYKSFNEAVQALYVSQPALSRSISRLESDLGFQIFNRTNKGITPTPEGEKFIEQVNAILGQLHNIANTTLQSENQPINIKITSMSSSLVAEAFVKLCEENSGYDAFRFSLKLAELGKVVDDVLQNDCDLGIVFLGDNYSDLWKTLFTTKSLEYHVMGRLSLSVLISNNDPLSQKSSIVLDDLADHCYVRNFPRNRETFDEPYLDYFSLVSNKKQKKAIQTYDREVTYQLISRTKSYALAFNHHKKYADRYSLVCVPVRLPKIYTEVGYVCRNSMVLSPTTLRYLEIFSDELAHGGIIKP